MPWRWCLCGLCFAAAMRIIQEDAFPSNCTTCLTVLTHSLAAILTFDWRKTSPNDLLEMDGIENQPHSCWGVQTCFIFKIFMWEDGLIISYFSLVSTNRGTGGTLHLAGRYKVASSFVFSLFGCFRPGQSHATSSPLFTFGVTTERRP